MTIEDLRRTHWHPGGPYTPSPGGRPRSVSLDSGRMFTVRVCFSEPVTEMVINDDYRGTLIIVDDDGPDVPQTHDDDQDNTYSHQYLFVVPSCR